VIALVALVWLPAIGARDVWPPDEPRIAAVADELRALRAGPSGLVLLRLGGETYDQKPPLYYWMAAALGAPSGRVEPWAARLPSTLAALACVALAMSLAREAFGSDGARAAPIAGLALATSFLFAHLAQRASLDTLLAACELAAMLAWWRGSIARCHAWLGVGMLAKGPVALLPLAVIALAERAEGSGENERAASVFAPRFLALSLGPFALWGAAALALAPPGFFERAVVDNLAGRFFAGTSHARPFYYYVLQLPLDLAPTTLLLPAAVAAAARALRSDSDAADHLAWQRIAIWVAVFVGFFSLSAGKRGAYLLPLHPVLAVACAVAASRALEARDRLPLRAGALLAALALAASVGAVAHVLALGGTAARATAALDGFELPSTWLASVAALGLASVGVGALLVRARATARARLLATGVALIALEAATLHLLLPALDPWRSPRAVAERAVALASPGERIGVFAHPPLTPGLRYYAGDSPERFEDLADRDAVLRFLASRGSILVAKRGRLAQLEPAPSDLEVLARDARGEVLVLGPKGRGSRDSRR